MIELSECQVQPNITLVGTVFSLLARWRMDFSKEDLIWAAREGVISEEQAGHLWQRLQERGTSSKKSKFDAANVAYYFGALVVMSAMGWLMNLGWERFGGTWIFLLAS